MQFDPQCNSGEGMVPVQHDMLGIEFRDGVDRRFRNVRVHTVRQGCAIECHAFLDAFGEQPARLQKHQLIVEVAKGFFRFDVQLQRRTGFVALQRFFDGVEEVIAAHQKFHRFVQHVEHFAQRVFQGPGQADHALFRDFHTRILPWTSINPCRYSAA